MISSISGGYTLKSASGYYIGQTAYDNGLKYDLQTQITNTITLNNDGTISISCHANSGSTTLRFNATSNQLRFRYYKNGQEAICLYKLVETQGTTETLYITLGHDYNAVVTEPTCEAPGFTTYTCSVCHHSYTGNNTVAKGHQYTSEVTTPATCTTNGVRTYTCQNDNAHTYTETILASHKDENDDKRCDVCGDALCVTHIEKTVVENEINATCTTDGSYDSVVKCSECGEELSRETIPVTATDHNWGSWTSNGNNTHSRTCANDNTHKETANCSGGSATCQEKATCGACGQQYGDLVGHKDNNGTCGTCGKKIVYTWTKVELADIKSDDVVVIVWTKDSTSWAMSNNNGTSSAPTATVVTVSDGQITSTVDNTLKWNITYENGKLTIYVNGTTEKWLYCINNNNGVRVGTGDNKTFVIDSDYLKNEGQSRYVGVYNNADVRCYTTIHANIAGQTLVFYKRTASVTDGTEEPETPTCQHTETTETTTATCTSEGITTVTCKACGETVSTKQTSALGHNYVDGSCSKCGAEDPNSGSGDTSADPITASKTVAELITQYGWTDSTTKQTFELDDNVTVKINGGANTGKAYDGNNIRIYATDSPAGTVTITVPEGYELVSIKISAQTGTYAFLCVEGSSTDICNKSTDVSGSSVVLNSVKNGSNGKQVRVTAFEVIYRPIG